MACFVKRCKQYLQNLIPVISPPYCQDEGAAISLDAICGNCVPSADSKHRTSTSLELQACRCIDGIPTDTTMACQWACRAVPPKSCDRLVQAASRRSQRSHQAFGKSRTACVAPNNHKPQVIAMGFQHLRGKIPTVFSHAPKWPDQFALQLSPSRPRAKIGNDLRARRRFPEMFGSGKRFATSANREITSSESRPWIMQSRRFER